MNKLIPSIFFALLFATSLYQSSFGINIIILDVALLVILAISKSKFFVKMNVIKVLVLAFWLGTGVFVGLYASDVAKAAHIIFTAVFCGYVTSSYWVQPLWALWSGLLSMVTGLIHFRKVEIKTGKKRKLKLKSLGIYVIPVVIAIVFFALYMGASSSFARNIRQLGDYLGELFAWFPNIFNFRFILLFLVGLSVIFGFVFPKLKALFLSADIHKKMELKRSRKGIERFKNLDLSKEFKAQLFMFFVLNLLLFMLNVDDILNVWLGFSFKKQYLKEFVHSGTYNLIVSIIISVGLVLFAFRKNLNFYKSKWLKAVVYIWIVQNVILTASVVLRNWHYVTYYNLAYLRIGLFFFLAIVLVLLAYVFIMIYKTKTRYYLLKKVSLAAMVLLFALSAFDWDKVICQYNFEHAGKAYLHRSWMVRRDAKCLPILNANKEKMIKGVESDYHDYLETTEYTTEIELRIEQFKQTFPERNFWEWNYADWKAYQELK